MKSAISGAMITLLILSMLVLLINVKPVKAWTGTVYIRADGSIDPPTAPIQRNGDLYTLTGNITGEIGIGRNNMTLDGARYTYQGSGALGIYLAQRSNVTIKNMEVKGFIHGFLLDSSWYNSIVGNNITNCGSYAGDGGGIILYESSNNTISGNNITKNFWDGMWIYAHSNYNNISGNSIIENFHYGVVLESASINNTLYHNNFIDNGRVQGYYSQVYVQSGYVQIWDNGYPSGGNYWSNYNGKDLYKGPYQNESGSDGIGDTPHVVTDIDNIDHYPLVIQWISTSAPPIAKDFDYSPSVPIVGKSATFDASFSLPGWNGTHVMPIVEYRWNFGDGNITSAANPMIVHTYAFSGTFNVTLTVSDSDNLNSSFSRMILVMMPTYVSISTSSTSTLVGFAVHIDGTLYDFYGNGLENEPVVIYYTFPGATTWLPISSGVTDHSGHYYIQWIPSATGYFMIKAEWAGNNTFLGTSNNITLGVLPYANQYVFSVESNSTISALAFNTTSWELSFTASGKSGTRGYVKVTVAKSLVANITNIRVYLDGNQSEYSITSVGDSWLLTFNYTHSTHKVVVDLDITIVPEFPTFLILALFMMATLVAVTGHRKRRIK